MVSSSPVRWTSADGSREPAGPGALHDRPGSDADAGRDELSTRRTSAASSSTTAPRSRSTRFPGESFLGTVTQIRKAAQVVQNVGHYTVVVAVANPAGRLVPGMTANVKARDRREAERPEGPERRAPVPAGRRRGRGARRPDGRRRSERRAALGGADPGPARQGAQPHGGPAAEARADPPGWPRAAPGASRGSPRRAPRQGTEDPRGVARQDPRDPYRRAEDALRRDGRRTGRRGGVAASRGACGWPGPTASRQPSR